MPCACHITRPMIIFWMPAIRLGFLFWMSLPAGTGIYDMEVGTKLVKEMIAKDVNHPSIVIWDNGNEGGFNFDLDHFFDDLDIQKATAHSPLGRVSGAQIRSIISTMIMGQALYLHGHDVAFPTEFLHGLYDGGSRSRPG
jgi:hypothetical protein